MRSWFLNIGSNIASFTSSASTPRPSRFSAFRRDMCFSICPPYLSSPHPPEVCAEILSPALPDFVVLTNSSYLSSFQTVAASFAFPKMLTPSVSIFSSLFSKNTRGGGSIAPFHQLSVRCEPPHLSSPHPRFLRPGCFCGMRFCIPVVLTGTTESRAAAKQSA